MILARLPRCYNIDEQSNARELRVAFPNGESLGRNRVIAGRYVVKDANLQLHTR